MNSTRIHQLTLFAVAALLALPSLTTAQTVNYFAFGSGAEYGAMSGDFSGTGMGTHLGKHTFLGNVDTTPTGPLTANWQSTVPQVTVAADGSELYFDSAGTVELIPLDALGNFTAIWSGEYTVVGGTGRFEGAGPGDEPLKVFAVNDPFNFFTDPVWTFSWELSGRIELRNK